MKKLLLITLTIGFFNLGLFSQSFEVYDHEDNLIIGQTIVIPTTINSPEDIYDIKVKNTSGSQISARITYTLQTTMIDGSSQSMCNPTTINTTTGQCGMPWGTNSPTFVLNAGETSNFGQLHFTQGPNPGITTFEYKVYDINNLSDFVTFTITYSTLTAIELTKVKDFEVYPNPAKNVFSIKNTYGSNSYVVVYNVLGEQIKKVAYSQSDKIAIDCSDWQNGYYLCRLYNEGKVEKTVKLVVAK